MLTLLVALGVTLPLGAQESSAADSEEPKYEVELEKTSHVVRQEEDRLHFRYHAGKWDFEGLVASLTPPFRDDRDQIGLMVSRLFDWGEWTAVARLTDKPVGEDVVGGVRFKRASGQSAWGAEATFGQADLLIDDFLVDDGEAQFVGRFFWRRGSGPEVTVFGATSATFDLMRGAGELLERWPRSEIVGAETLADLYVDEDRLEDSVGVRVAFERDRWRASLYLKGGEQTTKGIFEPDDFVGVGGTFRYGRKSWNVDAELDLRQIDTPFDSFERGRALVDFRHRPGRFEWGLGAYVQGEAATASEIPDFYDTAGGGATFSWQRSNGTKIGLWAMWEDNAPDLQVITRVVAFHRTAEREYGVGVRRDETGSQNFKDETFGPYFVVRVPVGDMVLDGDLGVQDSDVYGKLSLKLKR